MLAATIDGQTNPLARYDGKADINSLVCSANGQTILFLSASHDRLYVYDRNELSTYHYVAGSEFSVRFGRLMSPDGDVIALPGNTELASGKDVLRSKRVVPVDTADVFWTSKHVFYRQSSGSRFTVLSRGAFSKSGTIDFGASVLVDDILECGAGNYFVVYSDDRDNRFAAQLPSPTSNRLGARFAENVGDTAFGAGSCIFPIVGVNDSGVSAVKELMLVTNVRSSKLDVRALNFQHARFYPSKDTQFLVTFQESGPGDAVKQNRIVVLQVAGSAPR